MAKRKKNQRIIVSTGKRKKKTKTKTKYFHGYCISTMELIKARVTLIEIEFGSNLVPFLKYKIAFI